MAALLTEAERLLSREQAAQVLKDAGVTVTELVKVCDDDAILYLGAGRCPMTAWLYRDPVGIMVSCEPGWLSDPTVSARDLRTVPFPTVV